MDNLNIDTIKNILAQSNIEYAGIFGSRVRGDIRPDSDVDLLIQFKEGNVMGLFEFIALERKLSETLGLKVDLVTQDSISPYIKESILKDLKIVYRS